MIEFLGWFGAVCFAVSAIPQAWACWRQGHARGLSPCFLAFWAGGEVTVLSYSIAKGLWPLVFNYAVNGAALAVILWYFTWPRPSGGPVLGLKPEPARHTTPGARVQGQPHVRNGSAQ